MKKIFVSAAALAVAFALAAAPVRAQDSKPAAGHKVEQKPAPKEARPKADVRAEIFEQLEDAREKLLALATVIPAEKYTWRPGEGVRSVGEVFAHVAAANYFLPTFWGAKVPEGVDPRNFEKDGADKAKTIATLKKSFDHLRAEASSLPEDDLDRTITFFGRVAVVRDVLLTLASHAHEHLGQSIAYARTNKITPPWSAKEGQ